MVLGGVKEAGFWFWVVDHRDVWDIFSREAHFIWKVVFARPFNFFVINSFQAKFVVQDIFDFFCSCALHFLDCALFCTVG